MEPIPTIAPALALGIPHLIMMGAISAPADNADAKEEPVTIAGNMMISINAISSKDGTRRNAFTSTALMYSNAPVICIAPIKIIAVVMIRMVSK